MPNLKPYLKISVFLDFRIVGLILSLMLVPGIQAETLSSQNGESFWKLWAKPRICIIPENHRLCKMQTELGWLSFEQADVCLSSSAHDGALQCWENAQSGQLLQNIITEKSVTFWLNRVGKKEVLIKTDIRIIRIPKKQVRRRRRHIWSLL